MSPALRVALPAKWVSAWPASPVCTFGRGAVWECAPLVPFPTSPNAPPAPPPAKPATAWPPTALPALPFCCSAWDPASLHVPWPASLSTRTIPAKAVTLPACLASLLLRTAPVATPPLDWPFFWITVVWSSAPNYTTPTLKESVFSAIRFSSTAPTVPLPQPACPAMLATTSSIATARLRSRKGTSPSMDNSCPATRPA